MPHKKSDIPVMFFGTLEIAWIGQPDVVRFREGIQQGYLSKGKHKSFQKACVQVRTSQCHLSGLRNATVYVTHTSAEPCLTCSMLHPSRFKNSWWWTRRERHLSTGGAGHPLMVSAWWSAQHTPMHATWAHGGSSKPNLVMICCATCQRIWL